MIEVKRFMIYWYDDIERRNKWAGYDDIKSANQAVVHLVQLGREPKLLQLLKDYSK